jgi:hypothetical protein
MKPSPSRRGLTISLLAAALALLPALPAQAASLYPDLKTLPVRDLRFDRTDVHPDGGGVMHNVLRFSNTVWNAGQGPLELRSQIDPSTKTGPATQRVYDDTGGQSNLAAGQFYFHLAHNHYHYDDWGRYELWTKAEYDAWIASGRTIGGPEDARGVKTSSCGIDEEFIRHLPPTPYPDVYRPSGCSPNGQGTMVQGISVGWGDTYDYFRFEQWVDLGPSGSLADGQYVLRSVADPLNKIYESPNRADPARESELDNEAITPFSVQNGQLVDTNAPSGTVRINDIAAGTATPNVTVKLLGRDDISGVTQVRLSNNGSTWSTPQSYTGSGSTAQSISWDLTNPAFGGTNTDGTKTVYAQFRDATGKWSGSETDTIVLDRGGGTSGYSNAVISDGPSGYWRLGELSGTLADDAAANNNGTYTNAPQLGQASLLPGDSANRSVRFDGVNDHVRVPSAGTLSPATNVTVEAWIRPAALPASGGFASVATKRESYSIQFNGPRLEFTIMQAGVRQRLQAPVGAVGVNQTYHVVGTYDGAVQRLYIDGAEVANRSLTGAITTNSNFVAIGSWSGSNEFFNGTIDEVAVYTSALSPARVAAHHQAGLGGPPPDPTVAAPTNLNATTVSSTQIDLTWTDNSSNETEFIIQRDTNSNFSSPVTLSTWGDDTNFSDLNLSPSTTYHYRVRARNATDSSDWSNVDSATTLAQTNPVAAPSNLNATAVSSTQIDLTWSDNSSNETEFVLERDTSASFNSPVAVTLPANTTGYASTGLTPSTTYHYRVRARNATEQSAFSAPDSATTQAAPNPVAAPTNLDATTASSSQINLSWADNASNETGFVLERDISASFSAPQQTILGANTTTHAATGLLPNTTYFFRVRARNATESSDWSNTDSATTSAAPPPSAAYRDVVMTDSPVSYWRLGETSGTTAADQRGTNAGTYQSSPTLGAPSLLASDSANRAVSFDGTNDRVRVSSSASLRIASPLTIEAWIKPTSLPGTGAFASVVTKAESYSLQFNGPRLELTIIQSGTRRRLQAPVGAIVAGQTYHVVGTYDGTTQRLYVNGTQVASTGLTGGATLNNNALYIASWNGAREYFRGVIDEVAVYGSALSATRVDAHYDAGSASGMVAMRSPLAAQTLLAANRSGGAAPGHAASYYCPLIDRRA